MTAGSPAISPLPTRMGAHPLAVFTGPQLVASLVHARGALVLRLVGSAGIASAQTLEDAIAAAARLPDRVVVADLSGLEFISSVGVGQLLALHRRVQGRGGELRIGGVSQSVAAALAYVRVHELVPVYASVLDAVP